jgi:3-hydroxyacyl-CoA dehydrogenase
MGTNVILSESTTFELRGGRNIKVYPASLETLALISPKLSALDKISEDTDMATQIETFIDIVFELIKEDNDVKKEELKKILTINACTKIIQTATSIG